MMMYKQSTLLILLALFFVACGGDDAKVTQAKSDKSVASNSVMKETPTGQAERRSDFNSPLENTSWLAVSLKSANGNVEFEQTGDEIVQLRFAQGIIFGKSLCNEFNAGYDIAEEGKIVTDKFKSSSISCTGKAGATERQLFDLIKSADSYQKTGENRMVLRHNESELALVKK